MILLLFSIFGCFLLINGKTFVESEVQYTYERFDAAYGKIASASNIEKKSEQNSLPPPGYVTNSDYNGCEKYFTGAPNKGGLIEVELDYYFYLNSSTVIYEEFERMEVRFRQYNIPRLIHSCSADETIQCAKKLTKHILVQAQHSNSTLNVCSMKAYLRLFVKEVPHILTLDNLGFTATTVTEPFGLLHSYFDDLLPGYPFLADIPAHLLLSWYNIKFLMPMFIVEVQVEKRLTTSFSLAYRYYETREMSVYTEDNTTKSFVIDDSADWSIFVLSNGFVASDMNFHLLTPVTYGLIPLNCLLLGFKAVRFEQEHEPVQRIPIMLTNDVEIHMELTATTLVTGLHFNQSPFFKRFCIYYELDEETFMYKDDSANPMPTVFIGGESRLNVRPFYADKMIFRCLKYSDDNVLPVLLDVLGASTDKPTHYYTRFLVGTVILLDLRVLNDGNRVMPFFTEYWANIYKSVPAFRFKSNYLGAECLTRPHTCDTGFTVNFNFTYIQEMNPGHTLYAHPTYHVSFACTDDGCPVNEPTVFGNNIVNTTIIPRYTMIRYTYLSIKSYIAVQKCELEFPATGTDLIIPSTVMFFIASGSYTYITTARFVAMMKASKLKEVPYIPTTRGKEFSWKGDSTLDVTDIVKEALEEFVGLPQHFVFVFAFGGTNTVSTIDASYIRMKFQYIIKVPRSIYEANINKYTESMSSQDMEVTLNDAKVLVGVKIRAKLPSVAQITDITLSVRSTKGFSVTGLSIQLYQANAHDWLDVKIFDSGEAHVNGRYYQLPYPIVLKVFRIRIVCKDISNHFDDYDVIPVVSDIRHDLDEIHPVISAGLMGTNNSHSGLGFTIFYDKGEDIVIGLVRTPDTKYVLQYPLSKTGKKEVTFMWRTNSTFEMLIGNDSVAIDNGTSVELQSAVTEQEYLLLYANYKYRFSYTKHDIEFINIWRRSMPIDDRTFYYEYLNPDNNQLLKFKVYERLEYYRTENTATGFKHAPDCSCPYTSCPCDTDDKTVSFPFYSKTADFIDADDTIQLLFDVDINFLTTKMVKITFSLRMNNNIDNETCHNITTTRTSYPLKWCRLSWLQDIEYESPDIKEMVLTEVRLTNQHLALKDFNVYVMNKDYKLSLASNISTLNVVYESAVSQSSATYLYTPSSIVQPASSKLYKYLYPINSCFAFQYKIVGEGVSYITVEATSTYYHSYNQKKIFSHSVDKNVWNTFMLPMFDRYVVITVVKNGLADGYAAFKQLTILSDRCSIVPNRTFTDGVTKNYEIMKARLEKVDFPLPVLVVPFLVDFNYISNLTIIIQTLVGGAIERSSVYQYQSSHRRGKFTYKLPTGAISTTFTICSWIYHHTNKYYPSSIQLHNNRYDIFKLDFDDKYSRLSSDNSTKVLKKDTGTKHKWMYVILEYHHSNEELKVYFNFKEIFKLNLAISQFYLNGTLETPWITVGHQKYSVQVFDVILNPFEKDQSKLSVERFTPNACPGEKPQCKRCNQFTGNWEFYENNNVFMQEDCQHALAKYDLAAYYPFTFDGSITSNVFDVSDHLNISRDYLQLGVVNEGLCFKESKEDTLLMMINPNYCEDEKCSFSMWIKYYCEMNSTTTVVKAPWFTLLCYNSSHDDVDATLPYSTILYRSCEYHFIAKIGLWYQLNLIFRNDGLEVSINGGEEMEVIEDCSLPVQVISSDGIVISPPYRTTCIDEINMRKSRTRDFFDIMRSIYDEIIYGINGVINPDICAPFYLSYSLKYHYYSKYGHGYVHTKTLFDILKNQILTSTNLTVESVKIELPKVVHLVTQSYYVKEFYVRFCFQHVPKDIFSSMIENIDDFVTAVKDPIDESTVPIDHIGLEIVKISEESEIEYIDIGDTFVIFKWHQASWSYILSITELFAKAFPVDERLEIATNSSNNTNYIYIKDLHPSNEYQLCIVAIPLRGTAADYCAKKPIFKTLSRAPLFGPNLTDFSYGPYGPLSTISFTIQPLNDTLWLFQWDTSSNYSYMYYYKEARDIGDDEQALDINQWNITDDSYESGIVSHDLASSHDITIDTISLYELMVIVVFATNDGGWGIRNLYYFRSAPGAPANPPSDFSASLKVSLYSATLSWTPLANKASIWNFDYPNNGTYSIYVKTRDNTDSSSSLVTRNLTSSPFTLSINRSISHHVFQFRIAAFSVLMSEWSLTFCALNHLEVPMHPPDISLTSRIGIIHVTVSKYNVLKWRGDETFLCIYAYYNTYGDNDNVENATFECSGQNSDAVYSSDSVYSVENHTDHQFFIYPFHSQHPIDNLSVNTKPCNTSLSAYVQQADGFAIDLYGILHYRNYSLVTKACNEKGCSNASNPVEVITKESIPECGVSDYNVTTTIDLVAVNLTNIYYPCYNGEIVSYDVTLTRIRHSTTDTITVTKAENFVTFTGFKAYEMFCVTVAIANSVNVGRPSNQTCHFTDEDAPFVVPIISSMEVTSSSEVNISIKVPADVYSMNGVLLGVHVMMQVYNITADQWSEHILSTYPINHTVFFGSDFYMLHIANLSYYRNHTINLAYFNKAGNGSFNTGEKQFKTFEHAPNEPPDRLTIVSYTSFNASISWDELHIEEWNSHHITYNLLILQQLRNGSGSHISLVLQHNETEVNITDLFPFTNTSVVITSCNLIGCSYNTTERFTTLPSLPTSPLHNISFVNTSTSLTLDWYDLPIMQQNGIILLYHLTIQKDEDVRTVNTTELSLRFDGLHKYQQYNVTLTAINVVGKGPIERMTLMTDEDVPSKAPSNVSGYEVDSTIYLSWQTISQEHEDGILLGYCIYYSEITIARDRLAEKSFCIYNVTASSTELRDITIGHDFFFSLSAFTVKGPGIRSDDYHVGTLFILNGNWSIWSPWPTMCSVSCGNGVISRQRFCDNPPPYNGGLYCAGNDTDMKLCQQNPCSGLYLSDSGQLDCDVTCATKSLVCLPYIETNEDIKLFRHLGINCKITKYSQRYSEDFHPAYASESNMCIGFEQVPDEIKCKSTYQGDDVNDVQRICNCVSEDDMGFDEWGEWSPCPQTCGSISRTRTRRCKTGKTCSGPIEHITMCPVLPCPVDGNWGSWSNYSSCSKTCGNGMRERVRYCDQPQRLHGGVDCQAATSYIRRAVTCMSSFDKECNTQVCQVDGGFTQWTPWSLCKQPCDESIQTRERYCTQPTPAYGGEDCIGSRNESQPCFLGVCKPGVTMTYTVKFINETWMYHYNNRDYQETKSLSKKIEQSAVKAHHDEVERAEVDAIIQGSVIGVFTVTYHVINREQVVGFLDQIYQTSRLNDMPVTDVKVTSKSILCSPPLFITYRINSEFGVVLSWQLSVCDSTTQPLYTYLYYTEESLSNSTTSPWTVVGTLSQETEVVLYHLQPNTLYRAYLLQSTADGNGPPGALFLFQAPPVAPSAEPAILSCFAISPTEIFIEWEDITVGRWNGDQVGYHVKYKQYEVGMFTVKKVDYGYTSTLLVALKPFTLHWIDIAAANAGGEGPVSNCVKKTLEGVPSVPVSNIIIYDMASFDWFSIYWGDIPEDKVNGILRGYRLCYYLSYKGDVPVGGEYNTICHDFDIYTFYYKVRGLENYGVYNVTVAGYTNAGVGVAIEYYARTCKCNWMIFCNWYHLPPFSTLHSRNDLQGYFPHLIKDVILEACGSCKPYLHPEVYLYASYSGQTPNKGNEVDLKKSIFQHVDVSFPIYEQKARKFSIPGHVYLELLPSPGIALVVRDEEADGEALVNTMILGMFQIWPLLLVSYCIATLFGILVWFTDQFSNPGEFNVGSSIKGPAIGFWFSFVTMTTVGYGDLTPRSVLSRSIAMTWFLVGLVLNGIIVGFITSALTSFTSEESISLYNTPTGVLKDTFEHRYAIRKNANVSIYHNTSEMLKALQDYRVEIIIIDSFAVIPLKDEIKERVLKIQELIEIGTGYGFILSDHLMCLHNEIEGLIAKKASLLSAYIQEMESQMPHLEEKEEGEATKDIFSAESVAFKQSVTYLIACIVVLTLFGCIYTLVRYVKKRMVIKPEESFEESFLKLGESIKEWVLDFTEKLEDMTERHENEIVNLLTLKRSYKIKVQDIGVQATEEKVQTMLKKHIVKYK